MKVHALNRLVARQLATLPDSMQEREFIIRDILTVLPKTHAHRPQVETALRYLEHHRATQLALPTSLLDGQTQELALGAKPARTTSAKGGK